MVALGVVNTGRWCQETYETVARDAGRRARQLRKLGYAVHVAAMGPQRSPLGTLKMTLVDIRPGANADTYRLPEVEVAEWPR